MASVTAISSAPYTSGAVTQLQVPAAVPVGEKLQPQWTRKERGRPEGNGLNPDHHATRRLMLVQGETDVAQHPDLVGKSLQKVAKRHAAAAARASTLSKEDGEEQPEQPYVKHPQQHDNEPVSLRVVLFCGAQSQYLFAAGDDKQVCLWERDSAAPGFQWKLIGKQLTSKRISAGVSFTDASGAISVMIGDKTGDVYKLPIPSLSLDEEAGSLVLGHLSHISQLLVVSDNTSLPASSSSSSVSAAAAAAPSSSASSPSQFLLSSDFEGKICVSWCPDAYNIEAFCLGHKSFITAMAAAALDRPWIISGGDGAEMMIWNYRTGECIGEFQLNDAAVAASRTWFTAESDPSSADSKRDSAVTVASAPQKLIFHPKLGVIACITTSQKAVMFLRVAPAASGTGAECKIIGKIALSDYPSSIAFGEVEGSPESVSLLVTAAQPRVQFLTLTGLAAENTEVTVVASNPEFLPELESALQQNFDVGIASQAEELSMRKHGRKSKAVDLEAKRRKQEEYWINKRERRREALAAASASVSPAASSAEPSAAPVLTVAAANS